MAGTARTTQVRARERARTRLADTLAAQREREKANEDDLAAFFALTTPRSPPPPPRGTPPSPTWPAPTTPPPTTPSRASRTAYTNSTTGA